MYRVNWSIHARQSNSSSAWKVKRAFWRGRFRVRPPEPISVPRYKDGTKIGSVKRNHFWARIWPQLYPATSKKEVTKRLASPVSSPPRTLLSKKSFALSQKNKIAWHETKRPHAHYGGPSKAEPFFPTTCGPKNSPPILDRNAPVYVQEGRMPLQPTPCPPISMLLEAAAKKPSSKQKDPLTSEKPIRVHNTEIRRGAGRPVIQTDLHYNITMLAPHYFCIVFSLSNRSKRQAREYFQNQAKVANFNLLDMKLMKNGPSRIWKWWLGKCRNDWITTSNPNTTYLGLEPQSPRALRTKKGLHWQMQFPQQLNHLNLTCKLNAYWMHSKSIPNPVPWILWDKLVCYISFFGGEIFGGIFRKHFERS